MEIDSLTRSLSLDFKKSRKSHANLTILNHMSRISKKVTQPKKFC